MSDSRPSHPPGGAGLKAVTEHHRKRNDELEKSVGNIQLPAAAPPAPLSDEQMVAAARLIWRMHYQRGYSYVDQTLYTFEREANERLQRAASEPGKQRDPK